MVADRIEREILIDAPVAIVWEVVTEPEHVGIWFSDAAEIDLQPGGELTLTWREHGSYLARIEQVDPPRFFSFRWVSRVGVAPGPGNSTLVEFSLSAEGESTRLRVVETGFRELDWPEDEKAEYFEDHKRGWGVELDELRAYVSQRVRGDEGR